MRVTHFLPITKHIVNGWENKYGRKLHIREIFQRKTVAEMPARPNLSLGGGTPEEDVSRP